MAIKPNPAWRGDPTFLKEVLEHWGVPVKTLDGWLNRGHGDFSQVRRILVHHIGSDAYDPWGIARHPTLGLASQIHLSRKNPTVTLCGVGIAYHAGKGWYKNWPTNNANWDSIGIEAEGNGTSAWPADQMDIYYRTCAAILWFLGLRATTGTLLSHWEYSYQAQGKWDPGAGNGKSGAMMEMNHFRAQVNKYLDNPPFAQPKKVEAPKEGEMSFDKIITRFKSRVTGSNVEMRPIDALLNADAHSFVSRANTERLLADNAEIKAMLEDLKRKVG